MLESYCAWKDDVTLPIQNLSINDEDIVKHLNKEIEISSVDNIPNIEIKDIPNEEGYFMLWELTINDDKSCRRIIPIFINKAGTLRPLAGKKIWDILLKPSTNFKVINNININPKELEDINNMAKEVAYNIFIELKDEYETKLKEQHNKYLYAISLRIDAASKIGIKNIRMTRLKALSREKQEIIDKYKINKNVCPVLKPIFISYLER